MSMKLRFAKAKKEKTLLDQIREEDDAFANEVYTWTDEELRNYIISLSCRDEIIEQERKNDPDLKQLQEQLAVLKETYAKPLKVNRLKRKLILEILKGRGKL